MAGLQRTPAAYANEAALAISSRAGEEGPRRLRTWVRAALRRSYRGLRRPRSGAALLGCPGAASAGRGVARAVAANPPRRAGCKLWWRPRGAVSAGAPGSPLYRVSAPSPPPPPPPPPPGGPSRSERPRAGLRPGRRLCLAWAVRSPHRLRSGPAGRPDCLRSSAGSWSPRRSARPAWSGPGVLAFGLSLPALVHFAGSSGGPPGSEARGRSGVRTLGWRDFGKTNFPVRKRRGPRGSSPPCVLLPSAATPPPRSPPTPECPPRPPPPPGPPRLRARLPGPPHRRWLLKSRGGRGQRDLGAAPLFPFPPALWPQCPGPSVRACRVATSETQSSKSTKVRRAGRVVLGFRG